MYSERHPRDPARGHDTVVLVMEDHDCPPGPEVASWLRNRVDGRSDRDALRVGVVVGELLDNAWRHGGPPYVLELTTDAWTGTVTVRVRDHTPRHAARWRLGAGLLIVDGLVEQWGVVSAAANTTVWAKVRFDD
ncbi:ATP-binding protein [Saccharothrix texasensis]|uniref:Histidine kinase-like protein n=1 Tax=Saccharothrix texasensis TaxID=103734 RepID=A0A3N1H086_9PSEU|nr:ATP-binding protein [Saccharothrix texasensis]ROP35879.1 hypothetical protein EDD40_1136 [Saccharothrix texasensis]